jgi:hypothetical protein
VGTGRAEEEDKLVDEEITPAERGPEQRGILERALQVVEGRDTQDFVDQLGALGCQASLAPNTVRPPVGYPKRRSQRCASDSWRNASRGLSFGYITNGAAFVFLRINWHNPTILQYQLMEPMDMAKHHEGKNIQCSAAMKVLSFAIIDLTKTQATQDERQKIITQMKNNPPLVQELFRRS